MRLFPNLGVVSRESLHLCSGKYVSGGIKDAIVVSLLNLTLARNKNDSGLGISWESVCPALNVSRTYSPALCPLLCIVSREHLILCLRKAKCRLSSR